MKKVTSAAFVVVVLAFSIAFASSSAWAQCGTKGAAALAFAQILDSVDGPPDANITTVEEAIAFLDDNFGLPPDLWQPPDACVDAAFIAAVQGAMEGSVGAGLLEENDIVGLWEEVLTSIGEEELIANLPVLPSTTDPDDLPDKGWYPLEGDPEEPGAVDGPTTTRVTRGTIDATPVVP